MTDLIPRDAAIAAVNLAIWKSPIKAQISTIDASNDTAEALRAIPTIDPRDEVIKKLVGAVHNCVGMLDQLVAESGRLVEWDAEDPFRMGEWFEPEDLAQIESARAALAAAKAVRHG